MKINLDKKYAKICKYIIFTIVAAYLLIAIINWMPSIFDNIFAFIGWLFDASLPILIGFIIAYLLFAPMNAIENFLMRRRHFPHKKTACRAAGIIISYLCVLAVLAFLIVGIYFMIGGQLGSSSTYSTIASYINTYYKDNTLSAEAVQNLIAKKNIPFGDMIISQLDNIAAFVQKLLVSLIGSITRSVLAIGGNLFSIAVSIILSIYVLASYEYFLEIYNKLFFLVFRKSRSGRIIRRSLHTINITFSKYIRGQLIEASIVAILSTTVLLIIGVDYAVVMGIIAGICNLVPYIGPFVGIVLAGIIGLFSGGIWTLVAAIIGLFIVQQIDCNILCPKIVGDIVGLHPALILIAITIGGNVAGILGMIIAVPLSASIKIIFSDWFNFYMGSRYRAYCEGRKAEGEHSKTENKDNETGGTQDKDK